MVLSIGLVSFSGSHVCRFDINLWEKPMHEIPVGLGYTFRLRQLACLKDFIGGPAWILGKAEAQREQEGLKVSLMVQDLQELWGPIWLLGGTRDAGPIIRTERGFIVPLPTHEQRDTGLQEIECHWTKEIPEYLMSQEISQESIQLSSTSRILIGTDTAKEAGLTVNHKCKSPIALMQQRIAHQLQFAGTHKAHYICDGYEVQLTGGHHVNFGLVRKYKRIPRRTLKDKIIQECREPDALLIMPLLKLRIGLEVSACTGNAQRVTLWDALRLSRARANYTDKSFGCEHPTGDKSCISSCWTRYRATDEIDSLITVSAENKILSNAEARRIIIDSILALEHTGIDGEGNLQTCWPFTDSPLNRRIPPAAPNESNNWFRAIEDTMDVSTFAVLTQRCLGFKVQGLTRLCSNVCKNGQTRLPQTVLSTRILLDPLYLSDGGGGDHRLSILALSAEEAMSRLPPRAKFLVGDAHLTARTELQDGQTVVIATISTNPLRYRFIGSLVERKTPNFREHINRKITTSVSTPMLVY